MVVIAFGNDSFTHYLIAAERSSHVQVAPEEKPPAYEDKPPAYEDLFNQA